MATIGGACPRFRTTPTPGPTHAPLPAATVTPTPRATHTPIATPTPMAVPTTAPTATAPPAPVATAAPNPTPTAAPVATPTPVPKPTSTPAPTPPVLTATDREGLWAGEVGIAGARPSFVPPWLALRVIPGENPDVDPWRFEGGPIGDLPTFHCSPERREEGWDLRNCTGLEVLQGRVTLTLFVPAEGESGLALRIQRGQLTFSASLSRLPQLVEPQASNNVLRWTQSVGQNRGHVKSGSCCLKRLQ